MRLFGDKDRDHQGYCGGLALRTDPVARRSLIDGRRSVDRTHRYHQGIGRWTVEMLLMYSLERMDILPVDDFGISEGYRALKSLSVPLKPKELHEIGKEWAPHRTVASWYLWRTPRERSARVKVVPPAATPKKPSSGKAIKGAQRPLVKKKAEAGPVRKQ
jgi:hypothetical protein